MNTKDAEVARMFGTRFTPGANYASEIWPGYTGLVIESGELRPMTWGFPRHANSKKTGKPLKPSPVNNARDDKLRIYPIWKEAFRHRRCLIPVTQWCEPEGEDRRNTRTWYSVAGEEVFIVAGIWTPTDEWGDAYSMVMVPGSDQMSLVHDRMPTILRPDDWSVWTDGTPDEAFALLRTWDEDLVVDQTDELWFEKRGSSATLL
ncbi:SOS response-associated peptidase [Novosphingobium kaempferiae]|uniref:SOS response-associated peptidase n=1 Tax=Novosphingobium kaempferiae TaxID=2896849 RepID=UPI0030845720